jgi:hypothetical protein
MTDCTTPRAGLPFLRMVGYAPEQLPKIEFKVTLPQAEAQRRANWRITSCCGSRAAKKLMAP